MKIKRFFSLLVGFVVVTSLLLGGTAAAQEEDLPDPGITPDSPFYFFDTLGKNVGMFFAFGPEAKARKAVEYAAERLAEARVMAAKNRSREVQQAANGYDEFLTVATQNMGKAVEQGASDNISEIVAAATAKHLAVLERVMETVPEQAREAIVQAREVSINGQKNALRALARQNAERAIEINVAAIEDRLNRAEAKSEENESEAVEEALDDTEELLKLGEEISEIARGLGKDTTTVEQLVAKAASNHLEVLSRVYDKVPEQAKPAIERAIANSVRNRERVIEALKEKNALGEIPEEDPLAERIQEKVRERVEERVQEKTEEITEEKAQEKIRTQISIPKPVETEPTTSANETIEDDDNSTKRVQNRKP